MWNSGKKAKGELMDQKEQGKMLPDNDKGLPVPRQPCTHGVHDERREQ